MLAPPKPHEQKLVDLLTVDASSTQAASMKGFIRISHNHSTSSSFGHLYGSSIKAFIALSCNAYGYSIAFTTDHDNQRIMKAHHLPLMEFLCIQLFLILNVLIHKPKFKVYRDIKHMEIFTGLNKTTSLP